jgi:hypothetical protein
MNISSRLAGYSLQQAINTEENAFIKMEAFFYAPNFTPLPFGYFTSPALSAAI